MKNILIIWLFFTITAFGDVNNKSNEINKYIQDTTKDLIKDANEDSKNIKVILGYEYLMNNTFDTGSINGERHVFDGSGKITQYGKVGIRLLPNTWKINLEYNKLIKEEWSDDTFDNQNSSTKIRGEEEKVNEIYFNIYLKPIHSQYGDIGFGYFMNRTNQLMSVNLHNSTGELVDVPSDGQNNDNNIKCLVLNTDDFYGYSTQTTRYYITYNFPSIQYIPDGFGLSLTKEKSDNAIAYDTHKLVLNPEIDGSIIGIGIYRTQDELSDGFSFKELSFAFTEYSYKYYNYNTESNGTGNGSTTTIKMEIMYLYTYNKHNNRKFYASWYADRTDWDNGGNEQLDIKASIGIVF